MATADQYADWIVKNQDKKGSPEFDTVAAAYKEAKGATPTPAAQQPEAPPKSLLRKVGDVYRDGMAGQLRGMASIGSTLMWPIDKATDMVMGDREPGVSSLVTGNKPQSRNEERRQAITDFTRDTMGADPNSLTYAGGKFAGEMAGTAGAGGMLANGMRAIPAAAKFAPVVESGGFNLGGAQTNSALVNGLLRASGGAAQGGAQAALANPADAGTGAAVGAVVPGVVRGAGATAAALARALKGGANTLMYSALKPGVAAHRSGDAERAIETLFREGVSPTAKGGDVLEKRIAELGSEVSQIIQNSGGKISKQDVLQALQSTRNKFASQVDPQADIDAIDAVAQRFAAHPMLAGSPDIPVLLAQQLKQGTYRILSDKYGQLGSAETEAQKSLASGLREGISKAEPAVAPLNAREGDMIRALKLVDNRLIDRNKNITGLAPLSPNPLALATFLLDRSVATKGLAARGMNKSSKAAALAEALLKANPKNGLLGAPSLAAIQE